MSMTNLQSIFAFASKPMANWSFVIEWIRTSRGQSLDSFITASAFRRKPLTVPDACIRKSRKRSNSKLHPRLGSVGLFKKLNENKLRRQIREVCF